MRARERLRKRLLRHGVLSAGLGTAFVGVADAALVRETARAGLLHAAGGTDAGRSVVRRNG